MLNDSLKRDSQSMDVALCAHLFVRACLSGLLLMMLHGAGTDKHWLQQSKQAPIRAIKVRGGS